MKRYLCFVCLLGLAMTACTNTPAPVLTTVPTQPATNAEAATSIPAPSSTPSPIPSPTESPAPTLTPTPTPTETPTPEPSLTVVVSSQFAVVRTGPGNVYPQIAVFSEGITLEILGRSEDREWVNVNLELGQDGWISVDSIDLEFGMSTLAVVIAPPTPEPTATSQIFPVALVYQTAEGKKYLEVLHFPSKDQVTFTMVRMSTGATVYTRVFTVSEDGYFRDFISAGTTKGEQYKCFFTSEAGISIIVYLTVK